MSPAPWSTELDRFLALTLASGLCTLAELSGVVEEFKRNANELSGDGSGLAAFCDYLVKRNRLTAWQCEKLKAGRFKGFFLGRYKLVDHLRSTNTSSTYRAECIDSGEQVEMTVTPEGEAVRYAISKDGRLLQEVVAHRESSRADRTE
jgi:eukaryotic-like serine/threonine-protein kinase